MGFRLWSLSFGLLSGFLGGASGDFAVEWWAVPTTDDKVGVLCILSSAWLTTFIGSAVPAWPGVRISLVGYVGSFPVTKEVFLATYKVAVCLVMSL